MAHARSLPVTQRVLHIYWACLNVFRFRTRSTARNSATRGGAINALASTLPDGSGARVQEGTHHLYPITIFLVLFGLELALVVAVTQGALSVAVALLLHVATVAAAIALAFATPFADRTMVSIGLLATLFAGPPAAAGAVLMLIGAMCSRGSTCVADLEAWYERLSRGSEQDSAAALHASLVDGRAHRPELTDIRHFPSVIVNGSLVEKQALLGLIGLKYQPEYHETLRLALSSAEATVRVQAAAVYAKLRETYKARLRRCLGGEQDAADHVARARTITECIDSGFFEPPEVRQARAQTIEICRGLQSSGADDKETELMLCRFLSEAGEYEEVRIRLEHRLDDASGEAKRLYFASLMQLGRQAELSRLHRRLDSMTPASSVDIADDGRAEARSHAEICP